MRKVPSAATAIPPRIEFNSSANDTLAKLRAAERRQWPGCARRAMPRPAAADPAGSPTISLTIHSHASGDLHALRQPKRQVLQVRASDAEVQASRQVPRRRRRSSRDGYRAAYSVEPSWDTLDTLYRRRGTHQQRILTRRQPAKLEHPGPCARLRRHIHRLPFIDF